MPSEDELKGLYSDDDYHREHTGAGDTHAYRSSVELLRRYATTRTRLLDFGCGSGGFLRAAAEAGFDVCGIEFHPNVVAQTARATGLPVKLFEEVRRGDLAFDVIHLGDVFEHLPSPVATLTELRALLAPGGLFFVEGPLEANPSVVRFVAKSIKLTRRTLGESVIASHSPAHLVMTRRKVQEEFFTKRLGMRRKFFEVYESGWPYRSAGRTPGAVFKRAVAAAAVAASRVRLGGETILGNRFAGIFEA